MDQGWLLVALTSLITFLGCCVIYTDVIYKFLFPKRASAKPFSISHDTNFLICSLALSSGCLIFTSLYKLLPKSHSYLREIPKLRANNHLLKLTEYSCYLAGIAICSLMNVIIHLLTNESLVHCAHDGADDHSHSHPHSRSQVHSHSHIGQNGDNDLESLNYSLSTHKNSDDHHSHSHIHSPHEDTSSSSDEQKVHGDKTIIDASNSQSSSPPKDPQDLHPASEVSNVVPRPTRAKSTGNAHPGEIDPLIKPSVHGPKKIISLMDLSLKTLKGETMTGKCYGDIDCCTDEILANNHLHQHKPKKLYFCTRPSEENLLFFPDRKHMITDRTELASRYPDLEIHSPLIAKDRTGVSKIVHPVFQEATNNFQQQHRALQYSVPDDAAINKAIQGKANDSSHNIGQQLNAHSTAENAGSALLNTPNQVPQYHSISSPALGESFYSAGHLSLSHKNTHEREDSLYEVEEEEGEEEEEEEEEDGDSHITHHHHIKTPLSRLLSIGLQTIMAITLHKFPEGFIMYSTSRTNPELGMSIFLSMFIHNFVEGFTMTLPIYIALNSRAKALLISGTLGSLSQPIGACIGYYMFKDKKDMNDPFSIVLVGVLLAITSGFLTFISLQMFASAIGFGGKQEKVLKWSFFGIFLICLSNILL